MSKNYYSVDQADGVVAVKDLNDNTIIQCADVTNAQHYCVLLNQAYEIGFRNGAKEKSKRGE